VWLPAHQIATSTRERCTLRDQQVPLPEFGAMRMIDVLPEPTLAVSLFGMFNICNVLIWTESDAGLG
jgi:hypothetical protein